MKAVSVLLSAFLLLGGVASGMDCLLECCYVSAYTCSLATGGGTDNARDDARGVGEECECLGGCCNAPCDPCEEEFTQTLIDTSTVQLCRPHPENGTCQKACKPGGLCANCQVDVECKNPAIPRCEVGSGDCVECLEDADCDGTDECGGDHVCAAVAGTSEGSSAGSSDIDGSTGSEEGESEGTEGESEGTEGESEGTEGESETAEGEDEDGEKKDDGEEQPTGDGAQPEGLSAETVYIGAAATFVAIGGLVLARSSSLSDDGGDEGASMAGMKGEKGGEDPSRSRSKSKSKSKSRSKSKSKKKSKPADMETSMSTVLTRMPMA